MSKPQLVTTVTRNVLFTSQNLGTSLVIDSKSRGPQGVQGKDGESVDSLQPRIEALEQETDGIVNNATPLDYYNLAKN